MTLVLARPDRPDSVLARLDPRWKMPALLLAAVAVVFLRGLLPCLLALAAAVALLLLGRLRWRTYRAHLAGTAVLVALFVVLLPLAPPAPGPSWEFGRLRLAWAGVEAAARLVLKTLTLLALFLVLWATSRPAELFKGVHALRVPGLLVQLLVLTYRYLFLLVEELSRLRIALRVRGYRNRARLHSYRTVGHVVGTLLVRSYERSERVGQAMRCRGFDGRFRSLAELHTRPADVAFFLLVFAGAAGVLLWDYGQR